MESYLEHKKEENMDSLLIFTAPKVDRRKKLFKLIDKKGAAVECSTLKGEALTAWIHKKAARLGKKIDRAAVEKLLLAGDHNLHYLSRELEKYSTFLGERENVITAHTVDSLFAGDLQGDVFKLSDALAEGNLDRAYRLLEMLLRRREKPLLIFFMLVRHYRLLLETCCLLEEGMPSSEFASSLEVHPFVARKLSQQAQNYARPVLEDVLIALQNADLQIKTGRIEPEQALKLTLSRIDYVQAAGGMERCRKN